MSGVIRLDWVWNLMDLLVNLIHWWLFNCSSPVLFILVFVALKVYYSTLNGEDQRLEPDLSDLSSLGGENYNWEWDVRKISSIKNNQKGKSWQEKAAGLNKKQQKQQKNSAHKQTHASSFWITVIRAVFLGLRDQRHTIEENR